MIDIQPDFIERNLRPIFATPIFSCFLNDEKLMRQIYDEVMDLKKKGLGNGGAIGWWSNDNLQELPEFELLAKSILEEVTGVMDVLKIQRDGVYLTSMWANIAFKPEYCHQNHVHPNSLISGVLHVSHPDASQGTTFVDPRPGARVLEPNYDEMFELNSGTLQHPAREGIMYLFPSYLPHGVNPSHQSFPKGKNRVTISFNAMITGKITTRTAPLTLT
jgi:uncharacterized protein (TIGR02466 family)